MSDAPPVLPYAAEVKRKALHLLALVIPVGVLVLGRGPALALLVPLAGLALAGDWARHLGGPPRRVLHAVFGPIMRPEELPPPGGPLVFNGATWMCVAAATCVFLFPAPIAAAAITMQMTGDAAAALVGRRLGRTRFPGSPKSLEGSAAFALTAFATALPFVGWPGSGLGLALLGVGALVAAVAEAVPLPVNDNFRVPFLAALAMTLLAWALPPG